MTPSMSDTRGRRRAGEPDGGDLRFEERQGRSKRGAALDAQGFDAVKRVVLPANIQDGEGVRDLLQQTRRRFPFIEPIFDDAGCQGPKMAATVAAAGCWTMQIVRRRDLHRFVVLPKKWIIERSNRRLTRNLERYATMVAAFLRLAMIRLMLTFGGSLICAEPTSLLAKNCRG